MSGGGPWPGPTPLTRHETTSVIRCVASHLVRPPKARNTTRCGAPQMLSRWKAAIKQISDGGRMTDLRRGADTRRWAVRLRRCSAHSGESRYSRGPTAVVQTVKEDTHTHTHQHSTTHAPVQRAHSSCMQSNVTKGGGGDEYILSTEGLLGSSSFNHGVVAASLGRPCPALGHVKGPPRTLH